MIPKGPFRSAIYGRVEIWLPALVSLCALLLWESAARQEWISSLFFPPPTLIVYTLAKMSATQEFWLSLGMTLTRLAAGVAIGSGAGLLLGWLMGVNRPLQIALDPIVAAAHPLPKLAIFPIFLVMLGIGESSKIALVALTAFFPVLINTLAGVKQIDRAFWEVATSYGARGSTLLRRVILPGSLPMAVAGFKISLNSALVVLIAIEMLSARQGLGAEIWMTWQTLRTEELYAFLIVIALLGLASTSLLNRLVARLLPWHQEYGKT